MIAQAPASHKKASPKMTFAQATKRHLVIQATGGMQDKEFKMILRTLADSIKLGIRIENINNRTQNEAVIHLDSEESKIKLEKAISARKKENKLEIEIK